MRTKTTMKMRTKTKTKTTTATPNCRRTRRTHVRASPRRRATMTTTMGTVINLYVLPKRATPLESIGPLVDRLLEASLLRGPCIVRPPLGEGGRLVRPQELWREALDSRSVADNEVAAALTPTAPRVVGVAGMNPDNADIRRDFYFCRGPECAVAFYAFPDGHRLSIESESFEWVDDPAVDVRSCGHSIFDESVRVWAHFQGKLAPWTAVFEASRLASMFRDAWPELTLVEVCDS